MPQIFDRKLNRFVNVDNDTATKMVADGKGQLVAKQRINVISPEGKLGTLDTNEAQKAFKSGFRFASKEDIDKDSSARIEEVNRKAFDMPATTFAASALSPLTLGLSDAAIAAAGEGDSLNKAREFNPVADTAGMIAGTVASTAVGPTSALIKGASKIGSKVAKTAIDSATKTSSGVVSKVLSNNTVKKAVGTAGEAAGEGVVFGIGESVSDASLGRSDEVVSNLLLSTGLGAVFGGVGSGVGDLFKKLSTKSIQGTSNFIKDKSDLLIKKGAKRSVEITQGENRAREFGKLIDDPDFDNVLSKDTTQQVKQMEALAKEELKRFNESFKDVKSEVKRALKDLPKAEKELMERQFENAGEDAFAVVRFAKKHADDEYAKSVNDITTNYTKQASKKQNNNVYTVHEEIMKTSNKMENSPSLSSSHAKQLKELLESSTTSQIKSGFGTEGGLVKNLLDIRRGVGRLIPWKRVEKTGEQSLDINTKLLLNVYNKVNQGIENAGFGNIAKEVRHADNLFHKSRNIERSMNKYRESYFFPDGRRRMDKVGVLAKKLQTDPNTEAHLSEVLNASEQYLKLIDPEDAKRWSGVAFKSLDEAFAKSNSYNNMTAEIIKTTGLGADDAGEMAELLIRLSPSGKDKANKLAEMVNLQNEFKSTNDLSTLDKYARLLKIARPDQYDQHLKDQAEYLSGIQRKQDLFKTFRNNEDVGYRNTLLGGIIGGPIGAAAGALKDVARAPATAVAAIPTIRRFSDDGAEFLEKWSHRALDVPQNKKLQQTIVGASVSTDKKYQDNKAQLKELADPDKMVETLGNRFDRLDVAPGVQAALMNRAVTAQNYLQNKLPKDPLADKYLNPNHSKWKPSNAEMSEFNRIAEVVKNPKALLDKFGTGMVTKSEVEALKDVHPDVYARMQQLIISRVTERESALSFSAKSNLSILFDKPLDPTLEPDYIQFIQGTMRNKPKPKGAPRKRTQLDSEVLMSDNQRITMR